MCHSPKQFLSCQASRRQGKFYPAGLPTGHPIFWRRACPWVGWAYRERTGLPLGHPTGAEALPTGAEALPTGAEALPTGAPAGEDTPPDGEAQTTLWGAKGTRQVNLSAQAARAQPRHSI